MRTTEGDASATALDLRRNIAMLLLSQGEAVAAAAELRPLLDDLLVVYGPEHPDTREVAGILARIRITGS